MIRLFIASVGILIIILVTMFKLGVASGICAEIMTQTVCLLGLIPIVAVILLIGCHHLCYEISY